MQQIPDDILKNFITDSVGFSRNNKHINIYILYEGIISENQQKLKDLIEELIILQKKNLLKN